MNAKTILLHAMAFSCAMYVSACSANYNSIYRTTGIQTGSQLIYTDAKQNPSFVQIKSGVMRACAARSPDVLTVLASAASGDANVDVIGKVSAAISGAYAGTETGAAFGIRTEMTQAQMEQLYAICFFAMNGWLTEDDVATEVHRYPGALITMLAMESVGGAARPAIVTLGDTSKTGDAESLVKLQQWTLDAKTKESTLETARKAAAKELETKKTALDKANADLKQARADKKPDDEIKKLETAVKTAEADHSTAQASVSAADSAYEQQKKTRESLEKSLNQLQTQVSASSANSHISIPGTGNSATDPEAVRAVGNAVIVLQQNYMWQTYVADECLKYIYHPKAQQLSDPWRDQIVKSCFNHFDAIDQYRRMQLLLAYKCDLDGKNCAKENTDSSAAVPPMPKAGPAVGQYPFDLKVTVPNLPPTTTRSGAPGK